MKNEVKYLNETLSKITKVKVNIYFILSNQMPSLNKCVLGFKSSRSHSKGFNNRKKLNRLIYKFSLCNKLGHLEKFFYDKLRKYKWNTSIALRATNAPGPKKIWVPKLKTLFVLQECFVI